MQPNAKIQVILHECIMLGTSKNSYGHNSICVYAAYFVAFYGQYLHSDLMRASKATFERCKRLLQLRNREMVIYLAKNDLDSFLS